MICGAITDAAGASATHGAEVSTSKNTAPRKRTARSTSERMSSLTVRSRQFGQARRRDGKATLAAGIFHQRIRQRDHSWRTPYLPGLRKGGAGAPGSWNNKGANHVEQACPD